MVFSEITGFGNYCSMRPETLQMQTTMNSIKVCEYSRSRSFHDDLIHVLQDQASGERSQDQWSSGCFIHAFLFWLFAKQTISDHLCFTNISGL